MVTPIVRTALLGAGDRPNQDRVLVTENAVAVLDGASDSNEPPHLDGGTYADALGAELRLGLDDPSPLTDIVAAAIENVAKRLALTPGRAPSSTVAISRWSHDGVETYLLGDSVIAMIGIDGREHQITDLRLARLGAEHRRAYATRLRQGKGFDDEHLAILAKLRANQKRRRNRPGGYWIAEAKPGAAVQAVRRSWDKPAVRHVVLATDGVAAGKDHYEVLPNWTALARAAEQNDLLYWLHRLHDVESRDPIARRWPRAKIHDDKAVAVVSFSP